MKFIIAFLLPLKVLQKKTRKEWPRLYRTTVDDGRRQPIKIGYMSDSGNFKNGLQEIKQSNT